MKSTVFAQLSCLKSDVVSVPMANAGEVMLIRVMVVSKMVSRFLVFIIVFLMLLSFLFLWEFDFCIKELCSGNLYRGVEEFMLFLGVFARVQRSLGPYIRIQIWSSCHSWVEWLWVNGSSLKA